MLGFLLAVALHFSGTLRRGVYPLLVASQAVPIVIIAPLLVVWFGFGIVPKLAIIALVCFFPVVVTTLDALRSVDPDQLKLMRTLDATRWQAFRWAEAPAALPAALSGAKIAVAVAVIGAVFAEYAGSSEGLGHLMLQSIPQLETPRAYAAVVLLAAFAVLLFGALALAERAPRPLGPSPTGRTRPLTRRLPLVLLVLAAVLLAACGERKEPTGAPAQQRLRLMLDYFPNADHAGIYAAKDSGAFSRAGLDVQIQTPSDPAAPLKLLAAGQGRPRHLLRARAAARPRQGPAARRRRRARPEAADVDHVDRQARDRRSQGPEGQDRRHRGHPLPVGLPQGDPRPRAGVDPSSVKEVNVGFNLVPAMKTKKVDATLGAFWNYEGVQLRLREAAPEDHPHGERRRPDLPGARDRRPPARTWPRAASGCGASCARSARARRRCARTPRPECSRC